MAGFPTRSSFYRQPSQFQRISGNEVIPKDVRTYGYGYSSGFTPDSLLLTGREHGTVTPKFGDKGNAS